MKNWKLFRSLRTMTKRQVLGWLLLMPLAVVISIMLVSMIIAFVQDLAAYGLIHNEMFWLLISLLVILSAAGGAILLIQEEKKVGGRG